MNIKNIRNFSIIAHIDHGKSTIADRILELTETVSVRKMKEQLLDDMELERERGITIKAKSVRINYKHSNGETYILNLIDTPGHVDFSYEVAKAMQACEGVLLVVDASQGIEAQTFANMHLAESNNLTIIPVLNKIDLPNADVDNVTKQIDENFLIAIEPLAVSGKSGEGISSVLEAIIEYIPCPIGDEKKVVKALIIDSIYDPYKGVIIYIRMVDGNLSLGSKIKMMATSDKYEILELGYLGVELTPSTELKAGEVGYVIANIKDIHSVKIGDTITDVKANLLNPLPGYKDVQPFVFVGLYPLQTTDYDPLRQALEKLRLNDSSFVYQPETSNALGFGFRCGFLGLLHMEIITERLKREYGIDLLVTSPNVIYRVVNFDDSSYEIDNPSLLPEKRGFKEVQEPFIEATIILPSEMTGSIIKICQEKRGIQKDMSYLGATKIVLTYELPLAEILYDFYDKLKSISKGHASFDYEYIGYRKSDLVKLEILVHNEELDALAFMCHKENAYFQSKALIERLRKIIPRQMFEVPLQACVNGKIIVRENIRAVRKDVTAKCYGGDISRKRKLLEKQKEGKKKMKQIGRISIPQEAFSAVLSLDEDQKK
ncbi:MAG: elongation factor 4 [bacterium]|nr:elongation factor 4 [bacterium]